MELKKLIDSAPEKVKEYFVYKNYEKEEVIILPKEKMNCLYILTEGTVKLFKDSYSGTLETAYLQKSKACFGEVEIFYSKSSSLGIKAETNCKILIVPKEYVYEWMKLDFNFTSFLMKQLSEKLIGANTLLERVYFFGIKDRILISIYSHYKKNNLNSLTKDYLSFEVCAPIRSLNRSIGKCIEEGFIDYKEKQFVINSLEKLEKYLNKFDLEI